MGLALMNPGNRPDHEVYRDSLALADLAEPLGFHSIWTVEHHFTGHSPVPNPLQLLAYVAARTTRIELGTAILVLPWHDPLRVAEEISVLDILSGGRTTIGFGRGRSEIEYAGFGVDPQEGHARLAEGIDFLRRALTEDPLHYAGKFYHCAGLSIRPRPLHQPERGFHGAAHSSASATLVGAAGLRLIFSPETDEEFTDGLLRAYRDAAATNGHQPGPSSAHLYVCVDTDRRRAFDRARRYMTPMVESLARHYRARPHQILSPADPDPEETTDAVSQFMAKHVVGTPQECVDKLARLGERFDIGQFIGEFSYGGMPVDEARENLTLFAAEVLPALTDA
ncbi:LLM class flavin-dependent oxidoreductase [Micromonospora sp. SD12]|uniref:LLM class flavin-dependent oxidoreductase n=1 Tax=Micromonospora sp. SD12 TaxID=3452216 RepID=UPI003F8A680F